jgi:hypothetical protein
VDKTGTVVDEVITSVWVDGVVVSVSVNRSVSVDAVLMVVSVYSEVATSLWTAVTVSRKRLADGVTVTVSLPAEARREQRWALFTVPRVPDVWAASQPPCSLVQIGDHGVHGIAGWKLKSFLA